jgi:hypothetical protein
MALVTQSPPQSSRTGLRGPPAADLDELHLQLLLQPSPPAVAPPAGAGAGGPARREAVQAAREDPGPQRRLRTAARPTVKILGARWSRAHWSRHSVLVKYWSNTGRALGAPRADGGGAARRDPERTAHASTGGDPTGDRCRQRASIRPPVQPKPTQSSPPAYRRRPRLDPDHGSGRGRCFRRPPHPHRHRNRGRRHIAAARTLIRGRADHRSARSTASS